MSDNTTPPSGRARSRKAKAAADMDLPAADVREIAVEAPATPDTAPETLAETPVEAAATPEEMVPPEAPEPDSERREPAAAPAAPASPSRLVPAMLGLVAGLIGGVGGVQILDVIRARTAPAAQAGLQAGLTERMERLESALAQTAKGNELFGGELSKFGAATKLEIEDIRKRLETLAVPAKPSPDIDALRGRLGKLEGEAQVVPKEIGALGTKVGTLQPKLDTLEKTIETLNSRVAAVGSKDALALANGRLAAQSLLEEAFGAGKPYAEALDLITRTGGDATLLALVKPFAERGAPSARTLREEFAALKPKAPAAAPSDATFLDRAKKAALSLVEVRQVGDVTGKGDDSVLARIDQALVKGDLNTAFAAVAALSPAATPVYAPWRARLEARIKAGEAVVQLRRDAQAALARAAASTK